MSERVATSGAWPAQGLEEAGCCPACLARERRPLYQGLRDRNFGSAPGEWTLVRCATCNSAYLDPRPTRETIGLAYSRYFTHDERPVEESGEQARGGTDGHTGVRRRLADAHLNARWGYALGPAAPLGGLVAWLLPARAAVADRELRHLRARAGGRLLDVGCGSGAYLAQMRCRGWQVEGVEPDPKAVALARAAGLDVTPGTIEDLDPESLEGSYDAITLDHVLEHVHDPAVTLQIARRLLRPGGTLWLATPNLESAGYRRFGRDWLHLDPPRHIVIFTPPSLEELVRRCGFEPRPPPRAAPTAALTFSRSAAIRDGRATDAGPAAGRWRLSAAAALADRAAARKPERAEEIVITARRPGG